MPTLAIDGKIPKQIFGVQEIFHQSNVGRRRAKLWRQSVHCPTFNQQIVAAMPHSWLAALSHGSWYHDPARHGGALIPQLG
jgi:hypothetical protein